MNYNHEIVKLDQHLPVCYFFSHDKRPSFVAPHFHSDIEVLYLLTGELHIYKTTQTLHVYPGDIVLLNSNEIHSSQSFGIHTTAYILQISIDFINKLSLKQHDVGFSVPLRSEISNCNLTKETYLLSELQNLIKKFFSTAHENQDYFFLNMYSILYEFLYILFENFIDSSFRNMCSNHKDYERIKKIDLYIKENFMNSISLDDIASHCGLTNSYFSRFFKSVFGMPFSKYLCNIRLEHALNDLLTTNYPLLTISNSNGFANYQIFIQKFCQCYNMTPSVYRRKYKKTQFSKTE